MYKIKRDFFIIVFCGMKAHSLWVGFFCLFVFLKGYVFTLAEVLQFRGQPAVYRKHLEKIKSGHSYLLGCFTEQTLPAALIPFYQTLVSL